MSRKSLVSSIIIFLNAETFLEEAITSVLAQTYQNWELLLVDDGSTDGSTEIARRFAEQYPHKICYLEHEGHQNRGMSATRNLGISQARGEYIAFLDADDIWLPAKLEEQVVIMNNHPAATMVYGRTLIWHSWTGKPEDSQLDHFYELGVEPDNLIPPPDLFLVLLQNKAQTPTTCNAMIRREVFETIGSFEENFRGMYEDQAFFAKIELNAPVYVANACWAKYRQHPNSCSNISDNIQDYFSTRLPFLQWLAEYLMHQGISQDGEVWQALQKELWICRHPQAFRLFSYGRFRLWQFKNLLNFSTEKNHPN